MSSRSQYYVTLTGEPYKCHDNVGFVWLYEGEMKYLKAQYNLQKAGRSDPWSVMTALAGPRQVGEQGLYSYDVTDTWTTDTLNSISGLSGSPLPQR